MYAFDRLKRAIINLMADVRDVKEYDGWASEIDCANAPCDREYMIEIIEKHLFS